MNKLLENSRAVEKKILSVLAIMFIGFMVGGIGGCFISLSVSYQADNPIKLEKTYKKINADDSLKETINKLYFIDYLDRNIYDATEISNQEALELVWRNLKAAGKDTFEEGFTLEEAQDEIDKYFNIHLTGEDIYLNIDLMSNGEIPIFKYDKGRFSYNMEYPAGDLYTIDIVNIVDEVSSLDETYKVVVYKAYGDFNGFMSSKYYGSFEDSNDEVNEILDVELDEDLNVVTDVSKELAKVDKEKLTKVTYIFNKVEDRYIFNSYVME